jgi:integrase
LRALRRLQREQAPSSPYLFTTERRTPMSTAEFRKQLAVIGVAATLPYPFHPMLRHACGFALANDRHDTRAIQDYLGHREPRHTPPAMPVSLRIASKAVGRPLRNSPCRHPTRSPV